MAIEAHLTRIMQPVVKALKSGRGSDAVHQFVKALSHETSLKHLDLTPLLARSLGKASADHLVQAFAEHPCMACKRGLLLCDECDGDGFVASRVCDACVGLGASNCDFCGGSGWITYNYVPGGLRAAVVLARSKLALREASEVLASPLPEKNGRASWKELARRLLECNRLLGAVNNALGVARHPPEAGAATGVVLEKVEQACLKAARRLDRRLRQILAILTKNAEEEQSRATDTQKRDRAARRAAFYGRLVKSSDFAGTDLFHVYLQPQHASPEKPASTEEQESGEDENG